MSNTPSQLAITASALLGFAIGNRTACSNAISQAKEKLGITKDTRSLTDEDKDAIIALWQAKYNDTDMQVDIETIAPLVAINEPPAPIEQVETIPPVIADTVADTVALDLALAVSEALALINAPLSELELLRIENAKLQARIAVIDAKHAPTYPDNQLVRLTVNGKQIALNGAYLNALMVSTGIDKKGVKTWLESAVIDSELNTTEQVKLLIVRNLESELIKARE
jgi:hypothetical protein